jgi:signal transduction histidine kinase
MEVHAIRLPRLDRIRAEMVRLAMRPSLPRRTIRLRLTLLYGLTFLLCGAALLAITYLLVKQSGAEVVSFSGGGGQGQGVIVGTPPGAPPGAAGTFQLRVQNGPGPLPTPLTSAQAQAQAHKLQTLALAQHDAELHQLLAKSAVALAIMAIVAMWLGWIVAGRALRPLQTITSAARAISASNLHERLALQGPDDELTELGDTFDQLLARLEGSFDAQRQFVANASHELRTPLARQRTLIEVALGDSAATVGSLQENNRRVLAAGEQQEHLIEALLTLARSERGLDRCEVLDLAAFVRDAALARGAEIEQRGLRLELSSHPAPLAGDPRLVERLVCNLLDNAISHNVVAGWIEVRSSAEAGRATLTVRNSGPTVPPGAAQRLLAPFARLEGDRIAGREGLGLGLSIVQAIATAHGATLTVLSQQAGGLSVEVHFPAPAAQLS